MRLLYVFCFIVLNLNSQQLIDEIIAVVGNEIVTKSEVDQTLLQLKVKQRLSDADIQRQRPYILKQMVDEKLLYIKSQLDSVIINEDQLSQEAESRWRQLVRQYSSYGGESYLEQVYNERVRDIKKRQLKRLRRDMAIMKLREKYVQSVRLSRDDVYSFYEQYKDSLPIQPERVEIANIVKRVTADPAALKEAYNKALAVIERLKKGEEFGALATELSEGPSAQNKGYLGKYKSGGLVKEYEDGARKLNANEYTLEPVLSPFGYHVIYLHSKEKNEIETSHILFIAKVTDDDIEKTKATLDSVRNEILNNRISFEDAAITFSDDPSAKDKGGYLGIFPMESMPNEQTKEKVSSISDNEITTAFKFDNKTIQLIKLIKRYPATEYDIERDYSAVQSIALRFNQKKAFDELLIKLKEEIPIQVYY